MRMYSEQYEANTVRTLEWGDDNYYNLHVGVMCVYVYV